MSTDPQEIFPEERGKRPKAYSRMALLSIPGPKYRQSRGKSNSTKCRSLTLRRIPGARRPQLHEQSANLGSPTSQLAPNLKAPPSTRSSRIDPVHAKIGF